jgi:hypothetical protein
MDIQTLYTIGYQYYPRNVSPYTVEFDLSPETSALKKQIEFKRRELRTQWKHLQEDITSFYLRSVTDMTNSITNCPCFYCSFHISQQASFAKVHIWISLLIPYCIVEVDWYERGQLTADEITRIQAGVIEKVFQFITLHFHAPLFPERLQNEILPNVELQHSKNGAATFREVFFTDYIAKF